MCLADKQLVCMQAYEQDVAPDEQAGSCVVAVPACALQQASAMLVNEQHRAAAGHHHQGSASTWVQSVAIGNSSLTGQGSTVPSTLQPATPAAVRDTLCTDASGALSPLCREGGTGANDAAGLLSVSAAAPRQANQAGSSGEASTSAPSATHSDEPLRHGIRRVQPPHGSGRNSRRVAGQRSGYAPAGQQQRTVRNPDAYLTGCIVGCGTPSELQQLLAHNAQTLNPIHVSAAITRLAHMCSDEPDAGSSSAGQGSTDSLPALLDQLAPLLLQHAGGMGARQAANTLWALAKLQRCPPSLEQQQQLGSIGQQGQARADGLIFVTTADTESIIQGGLHLEAQPGSLLFGTQVQSAVLQASLSGLATSTPQELACSLYALARLRWQAPAAWMQRFMGSCRRLWSDFSRGELSMLLWAAGTLGWQGLGGEPTAASGTAATPATAATPSGQQQQQQPQRGGGIAAAEWVGELLEAQVPSFGRSGPGRPTQELCNSLWALGRLGVQPPPVWAQAFTDAMCRVLGECSGQEVAVCLWALGRSGASLQPGFKMGAAAPGSPLQSGSASAATDVLQQPQQPLQQPASVGTETRPDLTMRQAGNEGGGQGAINGVGAITRQLQRSDLVSLTPREAAVLLVAVARASQQRSAGAAPVLPAWTPALLQHAGSAPQPAQALVVLVWAAARLQLRPSVGLLAAMQRATYAAR